MTFTKNQYAQHEATADNGDKFQISNEGSNGWRMRVWNAAYSAWLGGSGTMFPTLKEAKQWVTENANG